MLCVTWNYEVKTQQSALVTINVQKSCKFSKHLPQLPSSQVLLTKRKCAAATKWILIHPQCFQCFQIKVANREIPVFLELGERGFGSRP